MGLRKCSPDPQHIPSCHQRPWRQKGSIHPCALKPPNPPFSRLEVSEEVPDLPGLFSALKKTAGEPPHPAGPAAALPRARHRCSTGQD